MKVTIDKVSGFCFGVINAIQTAEKELNESPHLYCLGDIVHNGMEVKRLTNLGLEVITYEEFKQLHDCKVLIRAHGEPPETYRIANENNITLIDASCPIVLKLQKRVKIGYEEMKKIGGQILIYGKAGHAEVNGLIGQTDNNAIVIDKDEDLNKVDFTKPIRLYSQTTKSIEGLARVVEIIKNKLIEKNADADFDFVANDTICRQVSNRTKELKEFSGNFEVIIFVSGKKSSNGMYLFDLCKSVNSRSYLVSEPQDINPEWFKGINNVGVCGATSTPMWLMEEIAAVIYNI